MTPELAASLWIGFAVYLAIGGAVALIFLTVLITRVSPGARSGAPIRFRLLIAPGCIALWPLVLMLSVVRMVGGGRDATSA